jgi:Rrf2 family transcriptional regulator, iron-sulfur cluster assembly transcription factor
MVYGHTTIYAIRGLSALANRPAGERVMLEDLVEGTDLPRDFLAKIFQRLVHHGLLHSVRGRRGGFSLARPAYQISILDIVSALEGDGAADRCVVGLSQCNDHVPCPQHDLYKPIRQRLKDYFATTTLADLAASLRAKQGETQKPPDAPIAQPERSLP